MKDSWRKRCMLDAMKWSWLATVSCAALVLAAMAEGEKLSRIEVTVGEDGQFVYS